MAFKAALVSKEKLLKRLGWVHISPLSMSTTYHIDMTEFFSLFMVGTGFILTFGS